MRTLHWLTLAALLATPESSSAGPIAITNAGFEDVSPQLATGQYTSGMGPSANAGSLQPFIAGSTPQVFVTIPGWVEDTPQDFGAGIYRPGGALSSFGGSNVAYSSGDIFSQSLNDVLHPGIYRLSALVGLPNPADPNVNLADTVFSLTAGATPLTPSSFNSPTPAPGGFATWTASFDVLPDDPLLGRPLGISLGNPDVPMGTFGVFFDNVTLTSVPEPSTLPLLAPGSIGLCASVRRRRRSAA